MSLLLPNSLIYFVAASIILSSRSGSCLAVRLILLSTSAGLLAAFEMAGFYGLLTRLVRLGRRVGWLLGWLARMDG